VGLLRKLSNEIINRCCSVISLPDIFNGDVDNVIIALEQVNSKICLCQAVLQQLGQILLVLSRLALSFSIAVLLSCAIKASVQVRLFCLYIRYSSGAHQSASQHTIIMSPAPP